MFYAVENTAPQVVYILIESLLYLLRVLLEQLYTYGNYLQYFSLKFYKIGGLNLFDIRAFELNV